MVFSELLCVYAALGTEQDLVLARQVRSDLLSL